MSGPTIDIKLIADVQKAVKGFKDVGDAAKKGLGGSVTNAVKGLGKSFNLTTVGIAGGAATVGGALFKMAGKFEDLALSANKFHESSGVSIEDASRWIEVTGDLGIESGTLEGALNKMNKTLGASPALFSELGVSIAKTKDGATDVNGTFLNVVDRLNAIKDPAQKAKVATQLLGKSWTNLSVLIGEGSDKIRTDLAAVSNAKVITDKEYQQAKKFHDALDNLHDSLEDLQLELGQKVVPALTDTLNAINALAKSPIASTILDWAGKFHLLEGSIGTAYNAYQRLSDTFKPDIAVEFKFADATDAATTALVGMASGLGKTTKTGKEASKALGQVQGAELSAKRATDELRSSWEALTKPLENDNTWIDVQQHIGDLEQQVKDYNQAVKDGTMTAAEQRSGLLGIQRASNDVNLELANMIKEMGNIPPSLVSNIMVDVDQGNLDAALAKIRVLERNYSFQVDFSMKHGGDTIRTGQGSRSSGGGIPKFAEGGIADWQRGVHKLAWIAGGETILPTHKGPVATGAVVDRSTHIYNLPPQTPETLANYLLRYNRRNGISS